MDGAPSAVLAAYLDSAERQPPHRRRQDAGDGHAGRRVSPPVSVLDAAGRPGGAGRRDRPRRRGHGVRRPGKPGQRGEALPQPQDRANGEKIAAMVAMATERLTALCAWPTATLHRPGGELAGFVMPKLAGHRPVFQVYGPKLRLKQFPKADWRFLVHAAGNVARAFAAVHAAGLVVGDVNHEQPVRGRRRHRPLHRHRQHAGDAGPPGLAVRGGRQHAPAAGDAGPGQLPRRDAHPQPRRLRPGRAVFQLLCMGRHPFAGRYAGTGEPPGIPEAIQASRYAFSADTGRTLMSPPPGSLPMAALPGGVRALFEAAFAPGARPRRPARRRALGRRTRRLWASRCASARSTPRTGSRPWPAPARGARWRRAAAWRCSRPCS